MMKSIKVNAILNTVQSISKIIFPLVTIPYASRILGSDSYGKVSFGNSIIKYFVLFAALGISTYSQREGAPLRDNKERLKAFANQVFSINVFSTLISYSVLICLLFFSYKIKEYSTLIIIQSFAIILGTLGADWINIIFEDYLYLTVRYFLMQVLSLILMFLFVKKPSDYLLFALFNVIASAGGNLFNIIYIRRYVKLRIVRFRNCLIHLKPILILFSVSITTIIYISSDITIIGFYLTDSDVGVYTMATNIYSVVKQVISAFLVVSIPRLAYFYGNNNIAEYKLLAQKVLDSLIVLLLPTIVGMALLGKELLMIMGGPHYVSGQNSLIILSIALLFATLAGFYSNGCLLVLKKDKLYLFGTSLSAVINILLNIVLIPRIGIVGAAITTLIAEMCMTFVSALYVIPKFHLFVSKRILKVAVVGSIFTGVICYCFLSLKLGSLLTVLLSFLFSSILYYVVLLISKNPLIKSFNQVLNKYYCRIKRK